MERGPSLLSRFRHSKSKDSLFKFHNKVKEIGLLFSLFSIELWKALYSSDTDSPQLMTSPMGQTKANPFGCYDRQESLFRIRRPFNSLLRGSRTCASGPQRDSVGLSPAEIAQLHRDTEENAARCGGLLQEIRGRCKRFVHRAGAQDELTLKKLVDTVGILRRGRVARRGANPHSH
ncbi:hypothetical protein RND71_040507 [Anisodus tanguticus]|uniref:Uncharacterized protein n=1 Tax=Anisodus tanguticus TaxID=243964 RepID=A0AAE1QT14_9SOLA|nr:hypothetical protein RND71_040507 [Anisodus tanguticus]